MMKFVYLTTCDDALYLNYSIVFGQVFSKPRVGLTNGNSREVNISVGRIFILVLIASPPTLSITHFYWLWYMESEMVWIRLFNCQSNQWMVVWRINNMFQTFIRESMKFERLTNIARSSPRSNAIDDDLLKNNVDRLLFSSKFH